ncbi:dihydroorotase [Achromatium sp. WMS2]|nr:dihydroorotase [Achromatium sp. WMS2]
MHVSPNSSEPKSLTLTQPDDWHLHLRDGAYLQSVLIHSASRFARAIIMPNLKPPLVNTKQVLYYRQQILAALPAGLPFEPLMVLYLTDIITVQEIITAATTGLIYGVKLYPAGATTNSAFGVSNLNSIYHVLAKLEHLGMPLLVHAETASSTADIFDREAIFINEYLLPITQRFPGLKIVVEHITTQEAVQFILDTPANIAATITVHHLLYNRNAMLAGGIRPHFYCLPILKREQHRHALVQAAISGNPKFFLGTDSAPHAVVAKESSCGCAGCFSAPVAIESYTEVFEKAGALDKLEGFAAHYGPDFYGLPRNQQRITLVKQPWQVPMSYAFGDQKVIPLRAGETITWQIIDSI